MVPQAIYERDLASNPVPAGTADRLGDRCLHGEIYKARPDVAAIVYTMAPSVVAFSVSSVSLPTNVLQPTSRPVPVFDVFNSALRRQRLWPARPVLSDGAGALTPVGAYLTALIILDTLAQP